MVPQTTVLVLPLLTLVTQQNQVNSEIAVSYIVALHIWFTVCIFFIFVALVELAVALLYAQRVADWKDQSESETRLVEEATKLEMQIADQMKQSFNQSDNESVGDRTKLDPHLQHVRTTRVFGKRESVISLGDTKVTRSSAHFIKQLLTHIYGDVDWRKSPRERNKIDYLSRILFPTSFFLFVVAYFSFLLVLHK